MKIHPISEESPDMPDEEFNELVEDIRQNGQLIPIWKMGDEIIDGRKRFQACGVLGIEPITVDVADRDPEKLSHSLNVLRTHYTGSQRAMFAARHATWKSGRPKNSNKINGVEGAKNCSPAPKTTEEAAKEAGVSPTRVTTAKQVYRNAVPEVVKLVEDGKISAERVIRIIKKLTKEEQLHAVKMAIKNGRKKNTKLHARRQPPAPADQRLERCCRDLGIIVETISEALLELDGSAQRWCESLRGSRRELTRIIAEIEGEPNEG